MHINTQEPCGIYNQKTENPRVGSSNLPSGTIKTMAYIIS
jgi:hypothetical protein